MLLDERLEFCDGTSVAAAAGAQLLGDVIDLGSPGYGGTPHTTLFAGDGEPIYLVVTCATQMITAGTAGAIQFFLLSDAQAAIDPTTGTLHHSSLAILTDDATAINVAIAAGTVTATPNQVGGIIMVTALPATTRYERYLGIASLVLTTEVTAGAINAFLTRNPSYYRMYQDSLPAGS